jgi:hypothetical protein
VENPKHKTQNPKPVTGKQKPESGQVMLLSVLIMTGMMASAMAVSLIMLNEIRLARQIPYSVNAIAAADAGIECAMHQYWVAGNRCGTVCTSGTADASGRVLMRNDATFTASITCGAATTTRSIGEFRGIRRSLETVIP